MLRPSISTKQKRGARRFDTAPVPSLNGTFRIQSMRTNESRVARKSSLLNRGFSMGEVTKKRSRINFQAIASLSQLADYSIPFVLRAICRLGVADHLARGPRSIEELAAACDAHAPSLLRALRALATREIFTEPDPGHFQLTPLGDLLRSDHPLSMRWAFRLAPDVEALANFEYSVRTGRPAFDHTFGKEYFEYLAEHPELRAEFDASQEALTRFEEVVVFRSYDWSSIRYLVEFGGGDGTFMSHLLSMNADMKGLLLDLPATAAKARKTLAAAGLAGRCEVVGGDIFEVPTPPGADAYLIKRVLVGLEDAEIIRLFRSIRAAMPPASRLLILEPMMMAGDVSTSMDLLMLVLGKGRVRTREEFDQLFEAAQLRTSQVSSVGVVPFIEARPA